MKKPQITELVESITTPYKLDLERGIVEAHDPEDHKRLLEALSAVQSVRKASTGHLSPINPT